ncbi:MAG: hypothetical protein JKX76_15460 [Colwellia sp.]|nr:hypothetical protein [Colwellia sp.]
MYRIRSGVLVVEYKDRNGPVFESDIIQAKTASLAARGSGYKVIRILVKTKTKNVYFDLPPKDKSLFNEIQIHVVAARKAKNGDRMKALPNKKKCYSCAVKQGCKHAI